MTKSIAKILADATAAGAADCAKRNPDNARMQQLAKESAERAQQTK